MFQKLSVSPPWHCCLCLQSRALKTDTESTSKTTIWIPDDGVNKIFQNAGNLIHLNVADCLRKFTIFPFLSALYVWARYHFYWSLWTHLHQNRVLPCSDHSFRVHHEMIHWRWTCHHIQISSSDNDLYYADYSFHYCINIRAMTVNTEEKQITRKTLGLSKLLQHNKIWQNIVELHI
jgi:hypothetical protein